MPGTGKMKHVSLTLQVENDLKHQLSIGALKPGARLITKNLAEQLGMSITPVREALLRLVSVNALSVAPAQAFTVPEVGKRQLDEINRIRYELELMAVAFASAFSYLTKASSLSAVKSASVSHCSGWSFSVSSLS